MPLYEVRSLDVWGNPVDGFEVNDSRRIGTCYIRPYVEGDGQNHDAAVMGALIEDHFLSLALDVRDSAVDFLDGVLEVSVRSDALVNADSGEFLEMAPRPTPAVGRRVHQLVAQGVPAAMESGSMPLLELHDTNIDDLDPTQDMAQYPEVSYIFWEQRIVVPASGGNMTPDEHELVITLGYYPLTSPRVAATVQLVSEDYADGRIVDLILSEDTIAWDLAQWQKKPRLGYDPLTREELFPERPADLLVALDRHMENL